MKPLNSIPSRNDLVVDQFTRQAEAFATAPAITNPEALRLLVSMSEAGPQDTLLDVACGPGLVVCAFAEVVRQAIGVDLTPAMLERASALQREKGLRNVSWQVGEVGALPFPEGAFSIVTCRYALHHFEDPEAVLAEMGRVCIPGGRIVIADVQASSAPAQAAAFNRMEKLRDPSHVQALSLAEMESLLGRAGLVELRRAFYSVEFEVESLLQGSMTNPGDADKVRRMFAEELVQPRMDLPVRRVEDSIHFAYPIVVLLVEKRRHDDDLGRHGGRVGRSL